MTKHVTVIINGNAVPFDVPDPRALYELVGRAIIPGRNVAFFVLVNALDGTVLLRTKNTALLKADSEFQIMRPDRQSNEIVLVYADGMGFLETAETLGDVRAIVQTNLGGEPNVNWYVTRLPPNVIDTKYASIRDSDRAASDETNLRTLNSSNFHSFQMFVMPIGPKVEFQGHTYDVPSDVRDVNALCTWINRRCSLNGNYRLDPHPPSEGPLQNVTYIVRPGTYVTVNGKVYEVELIANIYDLAVWIKKTLVDTPSKYECSPPLSVSPYLPDMIHVQLKPKVASPPKLESPKPKVESPPKLESPKPMVESPPKLELPPPKLTHSEESKSPPPKAKKARQSPQPPLPLLPAPGIKGLSWTGNSCYLDSVIMALFANENRVIHHVLFRELPPTTSESRCYTYRGRRGARLKQEAVLDDQTSNVNRQAIATALKKIYLFIHSELMGKTMNCTDLRNAIKSCQNIEAFEDENPHESDDFLRYLFQKLAFAPIRYTELKRRWKFGSNMNDNPTSDLPSMQGLVTLGSTEFDANVGICNQAFAFTTPPQYNDKTETFVETTKTNRPVGGYMVISVGRMDALGNPSYHPITFEDEFASDEYPVKLHAIVCHDRGHYTCFIRLNAGWFYYNDAYKGDRMFQFVGATFDDLLKNKKMNPARYGVLYFYSNPADNRK